MTVVERMKAAQVKGDLTVTDMGAWFNSSRASMWTWLVEGRQPHPVKTRLLEKPLKLLLEAIKHDWFPVPLEIRQYERKAYIEKVKRDAAKKFSADRPATRRKKMLGSNR